MRSIFASPPSGARLHPRRQARQDDPLPGTAALLGPCCERNGDAYYPPGFVLALHGHVHLFQALGFDDGHPSTLVAGNGGDSLDAPLPEPLPTGASPAPGVHVAHATTSQGFGFLLLERDGGGSGGQWTATAYRADGGAMTRCVLAAGPLACTPAGRVR
jgi:hypothetical protein